MQGRITADTPAPPKKPVLFDAPVGGGKPMLPERSPGADTDFQTKKRNVLSLVRYFFPIFPPPLSKSCVE